MAGLKEQVTASIHASTLASRSHALMPVDKIQALAHADRIGILLYHLRAGDASGLRELSRLLTRKIKCAAAVNLALHEWLNQRCSQCQGRGEIWIGETLIICAGCDGLKVKRYSNADRAALIGKKISARMHKLIADAHHLISNHDYWATGQIHRLLSET